MRRSVVFLLIAIMTISAVSCLNAGDVVQTENQVEQIQVDNEEPAPSSPPFLPL